MRELIQFDRDGMLLKETETLIAAVEREAANMLAKRDEMRAALRMAMEEHGVKKIENDRFCVSYVAGTDRETFDRKQLKEDMPDIYDAYVTMKTTAPSLRIKIK